MSAVVGTRPPGRTGPRGAAGFAALLSPTWLVLGFFFLLPLLLVFLVSFARADDAGGIQPLVAAVKHMHKPALRKLNSARRARADRQIIVSVAIEVTDRQ